MYITIYLVIFRMSKNKKYFLVTKKGFSIGEILLAAFVLSVAMLAAVNLLITGFSYSADSRDRIVASMLAQEGIEIARNIRDNNWATGDITFSGANFPDTNYAADNNSRGCIVDKDSTTIRTCANTYNPKILYINDDGYYMTTGSTATKFKRKIMIQYFNASGILSNRATAVTAKLTSVVIWGNVWPRIDVSDCTISTQCAFASATFTKWGE